MQKKGASWDGLCGSSCTQAVQCGTGRLVLLLSRLGLRGTVVGLKWGGLLGSKMNASQKPQPAPLHGSPIRSCKLIHEPCNPGNFTCFLDVPRGRGSHFPSSPDLKAFEILLGQDKVCSQGPASDQLSPRPSLE